MSQLLPAKARVLDTGDCEVIEPGKYKNQEIIKPYCMYTVNELDEITKRIASETGADPEKIIIRLRS